MNTNLYLKYTPKLIEKTLIMCWEYQCIFFLCPQVHKRKSGLKSTCKIEPHASLILALPVFTLFSLPTKAKEL